MESISIPFEVHLKLNQRNNNSNDAKDGIANDETADKAEVLMLYHGLPWCVPEEKDDNHNDIQKVLPPLHLFTVLSDVNIIPPIPPSSVRLEAPTQSSESQTKNIVVLHPLLEEFMVFSAMAIEKNIEKNVFNTSIISVDNDDDDVVKTKGDQNGTWPLSFVPVKIQYEHPPQYCSNGFESTMGTEDESDFREDHDLFQYRISEKTFYVQRPKMIHDLSIQQKQSVIHMNLEFIHCSNEYYEQWFISMARMEGTPGESGGNVQEAEKYNPQNDVNLEEMTQIHQYIYQILCQGLEYKIIQKLMLLPIVLPPYPSTSLAPDLSHYGEAEELNVAFFKLNDVYFSDGSETTFYKDCCDGNMSENGICYRLGALTSTCNNENYERKKNNYVSIQITAPQAALETTTSMDEEDTNSASNIHDECYYEATCPGYENLIEEIISMANISVESGSPTGVLLTGCRGVGKSRLVCTFSLLLFFFLECI